ncbi:hypothetical protein PZE06_01305 [Robertmurraya sp. DFI.2.37]|uniref:hypothetical protein n=1 Tax=Robertmurraya sp. DFI.2.37 TaxID=3031819 RepID=UPI0012487C3D|nr:hypothetical protein [Robertmurraya sp. DFI.2.37]MDF1506811.1 hypothetical protein [Robertmurraya sp. DFI.2.37]
MRRLSFLWTFVFCLSLMVTGSASAEETKDSLKMEELTVQILPEYSYHPKDKEGKRPPLLVGYHGSLLNNTDKAQKGKIQIPLPTKEKNFKIGFVADYSADMRDMYEIEYELDEKEGFISWETSEEIQPQELYRFVIEYYTDSIVDGDKKTLDFHFESFADIGLMNLIFVEPLKTESFKLEPEAETHQKNSYNMNMFLYQVQGMKKGEEKSIKLEYERADDRTTTKIMEEMAGSAGMQQASVRNNEEKIPTWLIITVISVITVMSTILLVYFLKKYSAAPKKNLQQSKNKDENHAKKAKLREMLLEGTITEEEYNELMKKLGG